MDDVDLPWLLTTILRYSIGRGIIRYYTLLEYNYVIRDCVKGANLAK